MFYAISGPKKSLESVIIRLFKGRFEKFHKTLLIVTMALEKGFCGIHLYNFIRGIIFTRSFNFKGRKWDDINEFYEK
jgi:hypothetical protein